MFPLRRTLEESGRAEEAEGYARRALQIEEATLEPDDMRMADTMHLLAQCIRKAGEIGFLRVMN